MTLISVNGISTCVGMCLCIFMIYDTDISEWNLYLCGHVSVYIHDICTKQLFLHFCYVSLFLQVLYSDDDLPICVRCLSILQPEMLHLLGFSILSEVRENAHHLFLYQKAKNKHSTFAKLMIRLP